MKIGIDCTSINTSYRGGVNTYIFGLLKGFSSLALAEKNKYVIFCNKKDKSFFREFNDKRNFEIITVNYKTTFFYLLMGIPFLFNSLSLWRTMSNIYVKLKGIDKKINSNCDILLAPKTILNYFNLKVPTILSMHDIQQYHYPEFFSKLELRYRKLTYVNSAKITEYFQASSHFIKEDLLTHFAWLKAKQIFVIPEGVDIEAFSDNNIDTKILEKFNLPEKFLFFPGQLWKHKNHITVLKALKILEKKGLQIPLVLTGAKYSGSKEIFNFIEKNDMDYVHYLGKVNFNEIRALYKRSTFLITAVLYESSSLPILEAAASGVPIIASKTPPNEELAKNLKISLFSPLNMEECANVIKKNWISEKRIINKQVEDNLIAIKKYSWEKIASQYNNIINVLGK